MRMPTRLLAAGLWLLPAALSAQAAGGAPPAPTTAQPQIQPAGPSLAQSTPIAGRASWLTDRRPLRVGDIVTILVDETVDASERQAEQATANRSLKTGLGLNLDATIRLGPSKAFSSEMNNTSRSNGQANRGGDLTATIAVRVASLEPTGAARIDGEKTVSVDGRNQVIHLSGVIRPQDLNADNTVFSSRIAEAVISYKGKKIGAKKGILGSILSILWP